MPSEAPDVRAACCCEIEAAEALASQVRIAAEGAALAFTVPRVVVEVQSPNIAAGLEQVHEVPRPSSRAPPLFLAHCSLLI